MGAQRCESKSDSSYFFANIFPPWPMKYAYVIICIARVKNPTTTYLHLQRLATLPYLLRVHSPTSNSFLLSPPQHIKLIALSSFTQILPHSFSLYHHQPSLMNRNQSSPLEPKLHASPGVPRWVAAVLFKFNDRSPSHK